MKLEDCNYSTFHPFRVRVSEIKKFLNKIIPVPYNEREKIYKLNQKYYMWGIDKAFLNIVSIAEKLKAPYVIPSNANINKGLVLSLVH